MSCVTDTMHTLALMHTYVHISLVDEDTINSFIYIHVYYIDTYVCICIVALETHVKVQL